MRINRTHSFVLALLVLAPTSVLLGEARGDILTTGSFQTGTPIPTLNIDAPIILTFTGTGSFQILAFDGWTISDGTPNFSNSTTLQYITYEIDGGLLQTLTVEQLADNAADGFSAIAPGQFSGSVLTFDTRQAEM